MSAPMLQVSPSYLYSYRAQTHFTWAKMCCELIDNSFNANAYHVKLSWPGGCVFRIEDDGDGADNLIPLITLGGRHEQATNDIGQYGVGAKHAMIWLWGVTKINSTSKSKRHWIEVDWPAVANGLAAMPAESTECSAEVSRLLDAMSVTQTGLHIECRGDRGYPRFPGLLSTLASTYTPALEKGKVIEVLINKTSDRLTGRKWPKCIREESDFIEAAGRRVKVKMGIVAPGEINPYVGGFSFERTYRVIKESTLGANGFAIGRIAGRVILGREWALSTNKDDFLEYDQELGQAIHDRFHGLMKEGSEQAVSIEDHTFLKELSQVVSNSKPSTKREKRNKPPDPKTGSIEPQNTGRKRRNASETTDNDGSVIDGSNRKRRRPGFIIEPYEGTDMRMGYYDQDGNRVRLNRNNPWLNRKLQERSQDALLPVVYGLLSEYQTTHRNAKVPLFHNPLEGFSDQWGAAIAAVAEELEV